MTNKAVVNTNLMRKDFQRQDGTKQLKVLAKVGYESGNRFRELRRYEIKILKDNQIYTVTDAEYRDLKNAHYLFHSRIEIFKEQGFQAFIIKSDIVAHVNYLKKIGFEIKEIDGTNWYYKEI